MHRFIKQCFNPRDAEKDKVTQQKDKGNTTQLMVPKGQQISLMLRNIVATISDERSQKSNHGLAEVGKSVPKDVAGARSTA